MVRTVVACLVLMLGLPVAFAVEPDPLAERIYSAAQERIAAGQYPSIVISTVNDRHTDIRAFGKLDDGRTPDADTVFEIGSVTKTFTATLLADEVGSGAVSLDTPVGKLLPDFTLPQRNGKPITLFELATQRSGLPRLPTNLASGDPLNPYASYDAGKLKAFLSSYSLPRDPDSEYEYSNLGFGLLGYALAQQEHANYAALLNKHVFEPLRMRASGITLTDAMRAHLASGHDAQGKATPNWDFDVLAGCGAIRSSAADLARYLRANMALDKTPLAAALTLAQKPMRDTSGGDRIGLAWMTRKTADGEIVWHNGMTGGYASFVGFNANGTRGVIVLTNIQESVDDLGFAALITGAPLAPARKTIALENGALDAYVGDYRIREGFLLNIARHDNELWAQATGQGPFQLFASATDEFFAKIAPISITFQRAADGTINGLVLHQNGDHPAPRIGSVGTTSPSEVKLEESVLRDYVGHYELAPGATFDFTLKDGQLYAQLAGQAAYPIYAKAKDRFFYTVVDAQVDFRRDEQGKVVALTLHQSGRDLDAPRMSR